MNSAVSSGTAFRMTQHMKISQIAIPDLMHSKLCQVTMTRCVRTLRHAKRDVVQLHGHAQILWGAPSATGCFVLGWRQRSCKLTAQHLYVGMEATVLQTNCTASFRRARKTEKSEIWASTCPSVWLTVYPSSRNKSDRTGRIFMKFDIGVFLENVAKIQVVLQYVKNNG